LETLPPSERDMKIGQMVRLRGRYIRFIKEEWKQFLSRHEYSDLLKYLKGKHRIKGFTNNGKVLLKCPNNLGIGYDDLVRVRASYCIPLSKTKPCKCNWAPCKKRRRK
jgi:hypothetical protein